MTIREIYEKACRELREKNVAYTEDEIRTLIAFIINKDKSYIYLHSNEILSAHQLKNFEKALSQKKNHYPIAYIIGRVFFYNSEFIVNENVLIPRPETEILVEKALVELKRVPNPKIIDFGCGSGCIALSLLRERPEAKALCVDISLRAIELAMSNARALKLLSRSQFVNCSIEELFLDQLNSMEFALADIVVANPPYIANDSKEIQLSVKTYEPALALYGGACGWEKCEGWAQKAYDFLKPKGLFVCEIGYDQKKPLKELFYKNGKWEEINFIKDYAGRDRVMLLKKA